MDTVEARAFITESEVLPPSITDALLRHLNSLPPERVGWLVAILDQAKRADEKFGRVSREFVSTLAALRAAAMKRVTNEESAILAEFERELDKLLP